MSGTPSRALDSISATALGSRLILTMFVGKATHAIAEPAYTRFHELIATMDQPVWISDATRLTGFDPSTLTLGPRWFASFKARGGRDCLVVSEWDRAMMAARTMALGLGVRVRNFSKLEDARAAAAKLLEPSK
jgi:hypothetical protein